MTNPQIENGYIRIATGGEGNDVLAAIVRMPFTGTEYAVVLHVLRMTWGYQKKEDWISISQFSKATNKDSRNIERTLSSLCERKVLKRRSEPGRVYYSLNKIFSEWEGTGPQTGPSGLQTPGPQTGPSGVDGIQPPVYRPDTKRKSYKTKSISSLRELSTESTAHPRAHAENNDETTDDEASRLLSEGGQAEGRRDVQSSPAAGGGSGDVAAAHRLFDLYEKLSGRKVRVRNKTRMGAMRGRLKEFTEDELGLAFRMMSKDVGLRGDNKSGVDYFSPEYATRVQNVERYIELGKKSAAHTPGTPEAAKRAQAEELPPLKITRPDGSVVYELPDGRCVPASQLPKKA